MPLSTATRAFSGSFKAAVEIFHASIRASCSCSRSLRFDELLLLSEGGMEPESCELRSVLFLTDSGFEVLDESLDSVICLDIGGEYFLFSWLLLDIADDLVCERLSEDIGGDFD